ncbi:cytolysin-activating lysine-acyltransferase [Roseateles sp. YR242]|uniref:toxin-activating lysine-acyltransferase n=1 Tax=Roseateles sp. YR242 TaxID=1855305 RepID=UPI0008BBE22E|nr:toxin-activating lysine-acyltransferase [Roseateles sp. YR242]SEL90312.1 cytolysin-activating lysine-acyltransferase [Roseateles sp. YR242]
MRFNNLDVMAPGLLDAPCHEAEVLGSAVWMWMHSDSHRNMPLHALQTLLLPAIKHRQFVLASEQGKPVFFLTWAMLTQEAERRYLAHSPLAMPEADWVGGDRMWILDWVAPFGHTQQARHLTTQLFATRCFRSLHHRGNSRGLRVKDFHGIGVMTEEARAWSQLNPPLLPEMVSSAPLSSASLSPAPTAPATANAALVSKALSSEQQA